MACATGGGFARADREVTVGENVCWSLATDSRVGICPARESNWATQMKLPSTSWFSTTTTILMAVAVCLTPSRAEADVSYEYRDDFSTNEAEGGSYLHSIFWPQGAFPPSEAYLYYLDTGAQRELAFGDYHGQPAHLGYCFPLGPVQSRSAVRGSLKIDVRSASRSDMMSSLPGYLRYLLSADGVDWSTPQELEVGSHEIPIESVRGTCYVIFFGTAVLIDNLEVVLQPSPATIHVPRDFATIQQAIDSAANGDIVEVAPGTYTGGGNWDIDFRGKAITVRSAAGPEQTIIDCADHGDPKDTNRGHRGFYFHRGEGPNSLLHGFTITGARVRGPRVAPDHVRWILSPGHPVGGGIYCEFSSPSIVNCVIKQCATELGGGIGSVGGAPAIIDCAIEECHAGGLGPAESGGRGAGIGLIRGSDAKIVNCTIKKNVGYYNSHGAGVYCWQSKALLTNCDISFNSGQANIYGGGIYCGGSSTRVILEHCIISNNTAGAGSGVFTDSPANAFDPPEDNAVEGQPQSPRCYVRLSNCTVAHNKLSGAQMPSLPGGGIHSVASDIVIRNSIVWYNDGTPVLLLNAASSSPVLYSNIERGYPGQGNIDTPPLFASAMTDYHLQSIYGRYGPGSDKRVMDNNHSPCVDAGDPQDSVGSEPLPNGKRINLGAYGGTREASKGTGPMVFHVDCADGNDSNTGLSRSTAFATIQTAVNAAIDGDIVMVWPGMYQEEVTFNRKAVILQSADAAAIVMAPAGFAFSFYGAESSRSILRNFVITNCGEAAVFCHGASPTLTNLTVADNQFGIVAYGGADPSITNCILWNNKSGDLFQCSAQYSCVGQLDAVDEHNGNINTNPLFADSSSGDYYLQSRYGRYSPKDGVLVADPLTSPCIDAGDPRVYPGRERMPHGGRLNMGAYGGTPFASLSGWPPWGDVNSDDQLHTILAGSWLDTMSRAAVVRQNANP